MGSFSDMHEYVEKVMERPVHAAELASIGEELKEKVKPDLMKIVNEER